MPQNAPRDQFGSNGSGASTSAPSTSSRPESAAPAGSSRSSSGAQSDIRVTAASRGRTTIADGVVEKIAGLAARDVVGVHALGAGVARTLGGMKDRVPGTAKPVTRGVKAEVGEVQTAIDLDLVVDYGIAIDDVARAVRENVITAVERMTGLEVVEVNIAVDDVRLPDEEDEDEESGLQ